VAIDVCPGCGEDVDVTDLIHWSTKQFTYWHALCWLESEEREELWREGEE